MPEDLSNGFDFDAAIAAHLEADTGLEADVHLQALAVLIDADLTDAQRTEAFASVMARLLAELSADEGQRFCEIAAQDGEVAAMTYLSAVTRPVNQADRR